MTTMTADHRQHRHEQFEAIGTIWEISISELVDNGIWSKLYDDISGRIAVFDRTYSRFRSDSLVAQMGRHARHYKLPPDGYALLRFYERLYQATAGKVTPFIGETLERAGYGSGYSLAPGQAPQQPPAWDKVLAYDKHHLNLAQPALLDFGAAGKGYLVDLISGLIEKAGIKAYTVDAGGDIRHRSPNDQILEVGLENPQDPSEAIGIAQIKNQSLCASAGSKRQWQGFHHIIDPVELRSPQDIAATWVIASDTMVADGLATALFFTTPTRLRMYFSFSYAVLYHDMEVRSSPGFPAQLFTVTAES